MPITPTDIRLLDSLAQKVSHAGSLPPDEAATLRRKHKTVKARLIKIAALKR